MFEDEELSFRSDTFSRIVRPVRPNWDDEELDPGETTYNHPFARRGPRPVPDWVITSGFARDTDLGVLKTGKEADVSLVERRVLDDVNLLAVKRYRKAAHRGFRNDVAYRAGRRTGSSHVDKAVAKGNRVGMAFRAEQWADHEFETLGQLWSAGVSVPYPVQRLGTELMIEFIGDEEQAAPRLVHARDDLNDLCGQAVEALRRMARAGIVHADLSPYNVLVWEGRLVIIDMPQAVDLWNNPNGIEFLHRDVTNLLGWFGRKGVDVSPEEVFGELL